MRLAPIALVLLSLAARAQGDVQSDDEIAPFVEDDEGAPLIEDDEGDEIAPLIEDDEGAPTEGDEIAPLIEDDAGAVNEGADKTPVDAEPPASPATERDAAPSATAGPSPSSEATLDDAAPSDTASADDGAMASDDANVIDAAISDFAKTWRVGDATPLSRRSPLPKQFTVEVDMHYGLVGTGPTRFMNDIRVGLFDWWELRTTLSPYPAGLSSRFMLGSQEGLLGAFILEGGLASWDAGLRLVTDETEPEVGVRFHFEAAVAYSRAIGDRLSVWGEARFRYRLSMLSEDDQNAVAGALQLTYDLIPHLSVTGGLGYAEVIGTPVRELSVNFTETDRPGMAHFLLRNDGWSRSVTIPMAVTYGRIDSFDVDVFVTPRVYPQFDILFGAGLRWRVNPVDVVTGWLG